MREITLKINVKDGEVKVATASLERMKKAALDTGRVSIGGGQRDGATAAAAKRLGISYEEMAAKVKGASGASKEAAVAIAETAQAASTASTGLGGLAAAAGPVGAVLAGVILVAGALVAIFIKLGQEVLRLAKQYADYVLEIRDLSEETGLATETISALRAEAERTGRSFDPIKGALGDFRKLIGQAAAGSEEARAKLNLLRVDGTKSITDIDGAFRTTLQTISNAPNEFERIRLVLAAFGTDGLKLLPFFKEFNGDVEKLIPKLREMGSLVGGKNVKDAEAFQRAYAELQQLVRGIGKTFGEEFLPIVVSALRDISTWVGDNRATIKDWAQQTGNFVGGVITAFKEVIQFVNDNPILTRIILGVATLGGSEIVRKNISDFAALGAENRPPPSPPSPMTSNDIRSRIEGRQPESATSVPDPAAVAAQIEEAERKAKEVLEFTKRDLNAAIELTKLKANELAENLAKGYETALESFRNNSSPEAFQASVDQLITGYINKITEFEKILANLEGRRDGLDKQTPQEKALRDTERAARTDDFASKYTDIQKKAEKELRDFQKKSSAEYLKEVETEMRRSVELRSARNQTDIANAQLYVTTEMERIATVNRLELDSVEFRKKALQDLLTKVGDNAEKQIDIQHQIKLADQDIAQQRITNADRILTARQKEIDKLKELQDAVNDYLLSLEDEFAAVSRNNRPLTRYEQVLQDIERGVLKGTQAEKDRAKVLAAQADAVEELNRQHAELKDFFAETFTYVFDGDFSGLLESFRRRVVDSFVDNLSNFLATEILGFDPNATDNPVAKPIVGKLETTNKLLGQLVRATGQSPATSGLGSLGSIFSGLFGGRGGGGSIGPGGTPYFNPNSGGGSGGLGGIFSRLFGGGGNATGSIITLPNGEPAFNVNGSSGGGFLSRLTGPGGIFGNEGFGNNVGTYGAVGAGAGLLGNLIGGRVGRSISSAGAGLALGAQIGSIIPGIGTAIGAVVGGIAGFFAGLFGGDPKRKRDKNEKIPALNKGFTDAFAELRKILEDIRFLRIEPDDAISRANEVRAQIAGGFGIQFESKKYRKQAQQKIQQNLATADGIIAEIRTAAEIARGAADRRQRILPEFAGGTFVNGLLPGVFDGRDNIFAMLSRGEMVLNPRQQNRVRSLAGFDVFAGAGIPNYPNPSPSPKMATGGIAGAATAAPNIVVEPQFTVIMDGVSYDERSKIYLQSADGRRTLAKVIKEEKKDRRIS